MLGVDVVLEARSRAALDKLARAAAPYAEAVREAHVLSVPIEEVVPGDLLVLREGHVIAADGVVQWVANLAVDESALTGESEPQAKRAWTPDTREAPPDARLFAGSLALSGHGFGRVTATGPSTQYGAIAALVTQTAPSPSPLQQRSAALVRRLGIAALIVAAGLFALSLWRGESWTRALLGAVSLAMAAIPEEFPVALTLFLSVGAWRLAARGMLARWLASVETLGSTTVICTDKTGILTRGEFQVTRHVVLNQSISEHDVLAAAVLACERHPPTRWSEPSARTPRPRVCRWQNCQPGGCSSATTTSIRSVSTCHMCGIRWTPRTRFLLRPKGPSKACWRTVGSIRRRTAPCWTRGGLARARGGCPADGPARRRPGGRRARPRGVWPSSSPLFARAATSFRISSVRFCT